MSSYNDVYTFIKRRKSDLISVFGGKCCLCGFNAFQEALEFHHVDPSQKEFGISTKSIKSLKSQLKELKKCILVCSNCHKGIHAGLLSIPENWTEFYSESKAEELLENLEKKKSYCKSCGKEITLRATYCSACAKKERQKTVRPDRETLKNLIRNKPFIQIARDYNVTDNAIRKWCITYNLPSKKGDINQFSNEDWEKI